MVLFGTELLSDELFLCNINYSRSVKVSDVVDVGCNVAVGQLTPVVVDRMKAP